MSVGKSLHRFICRNDFFCDFAASGNDLKGDGEIIPVPITGKGNINFLRSGGDDIGTVKKDFIRSFYGKNDVLFESFYRENMEKERS